jgi:hypothetical protein
VRFINLILAGFWFVLALVLLTPLWLPTGQPVITLPGTKLPLGWFVLFLGAYNVVRWWMQASYQRRQRELQESYARLHKRRVQPRPPVEPDPNFMFTDKPPDPPPQLPGM